MKILWLYRYIKEYDFDNWLHLKFVEVLKRHPGVEVLVYGPEIHKGYPSLTTLPYSPSLNIHDIRKHFDFDVMVFNTKSRMFMYYNPHVGQASDMWLPSGFNTLDVPRIMIEEDYHYEKDDAWYVANRMSIILQRHWSQSIRPHQTPVEWFPFSVDIDTFKPESINRRYDKICFAGSTNADAYRYRQLAMETLQKAGIIDVFFRKEKTGDNYVKCLRNYVCHLSCSSKFKLSPAKMFEIIASGSTLLTNHNEDLPLLFPAGSYYAYKTDNSDVLAIAKGIIANRAKRALVVKNGIQAINERHTHEIRINELLNIIHRLLGVKV